MGILMAGHRIYVPRVAAALIGGLVLLVGSYPTRAASQAPVYLDDPATAPTTSPETQPAGPLFLPAAPPRRVETSNGAELQPQGELIQVEQPPRNPVQFSFTGIYYYGSLRGNVQVPRGGLNGTSNAHRPTLNSIGINYASIGDLELAATVPNAGEFFIGAQLIQLDGSAFIGPKTLTTDGVTFPASSNVNSNVDLSWFRFGWRYTIPIWTDFRGIPEVTFAPYLDGVIWDYSYHLSAQRVRPASRAITAFGIQIGAIFAWRPNGGPLSIECALAGFPSVPNLPQISQESIYVRYHFYEWRRFDFTGLLGVSFEQQQYKDNQPLPNRVDVNFGPLLMAGLQMQF